MPMKVTILLVNPAFNKASKTHLLNSLSADYSFSRLLCPQYRFYDFLSLLRPIFGVLGLVIHVVTVVGVAP
jgi:hypothetical protein